MHTATDELGARYLADVERRFRDLKRTAERAMAQADDRAFFATLDAEANSIALLVKHMSGNLRSRFSGFLTADGEKPDRDRDAEFVVQPGDSREALLARWEEGWSTLFDALRALAPADLLRTVTIRGEPHLALEAVSRQLAHHAQHVGQIVLLAKHHAGESWETLTIPRGQSRTVTAAMERAASADGGPR